MWAMPPAIVRQSRRRYVPRMAVFVFRSEKDRRQLAFTSDEAGKALPANLSPWDRTSNRAVPALVGMPTAFQDAVAAHGHVVMQIARKLDPAVPDFRTRNPRRR
jgi:hypothetical protein